MLHGFKGLKQVKRRERPPSPKGNLLVGHLLEARRDPLQFALKLTREFGDIAYFRVGIYTGYLLNHPDYIQHVLQLNHQNYNKENYNYAMLKPVLGEGLLTSDGESWLHHRRIIQPIFHRNQLKQFEAITIQNCIEMLEGWKSSAAAGNPIDVGVEMMRLTLRIVGKALFSTDFDKDSSRIGAAFSHLNQDVSHRFKNVFVPPLFVPTLRNLAFKRNRAILNQVVYRIIDQRRGDNNKKGDLLDLLIDAKDENSGEILTDRQIRDEVMTLMLAGHETTAALLTWTIYLISEHPHVGEELRFEIDKVLGGKVPTTERISKLEYTEKVLLESLRLYPPVWIISRKAVEDDNIGEYLVPAGATVALSSFTMHRHPEFWSEPDKFDPERFSPEESQDRPHYAYFPFGGGPHLCVGRNFAMMEAKLILSIIAQQFKLEVLPEFPVIPEPLVTLRPRYGLKMRLRAIS